VSNSRIVDWKLNWALKGKQKPEAGNAILFSAFDAKARSYIRLPLRFLLSTLHDRDAWVHTLLQITAAPGCTLKYDHLCKRHETTKVVEVHSSSYNR